MMLVQVSHHRKVIVASHTSPLVTCQVTQSISNNIHTSSFPPHFYLLQRVRDREEEEEEEEERKKKESSNENLNIFNPPRNVTFPSVSADTRFSLYSPCNGNHRISPTSHLARSASFQGFLGLGFFVSCFRQAEGKMNVKKSQVWQPCNKKRS